MGRSRALSSGPAPPILTTPTAAFAVTRTGWGWCFGHTGEGHGPGDSFSDVNQFLSRHGRGAHFLYGDGHVRYWRESINYSTDKALSTRAAGEVISDGY